MLAFRLAQLMRTYFLPSFNTCFSLTKISVIVSTVVMPTPCWWRRKSMLRLAVIVFSPTVISSRSLNLVCQVTCVCVCVCARVCVRICAPAQPCPTLCDPMDCSPPGSSVHGIFQSRILEWVAISFSKGSSPPRDGIHISCIGRWILYHWATREVKIT